MACYLQLARADRLNSGVRRMEISSNLFRVIPQADLDLAVQSGLVPRCAADERSGCVHLNLWQDVETVANAYFTAEERPVALEIRRADIDARLVVGPPAPGKPWQQITLHQPNILLNSVVAVHRLEISHSGARSSFRLATGA